MKYLALFLMLISPLFALRADINHDGTVDLLDLAILSEEWLMSVLGPTVITEGDFGNGGAAWTLGDGWSVASEKGVFAFNTGDASISQASVLTIGKDYSVTFTVSELSGTGGVRFLDGVVSGTKRTANGTFTETFTCQAVNFLILAVDTTPGFTFKIDDVSVRPLSEATIIEESIYDILRWDTTVSGLVSSRIYPQIAPQGASLPYIVYNWIDAPRGHNFDGMTDLVPARVQFSIWTETYAELRPLVDAVSGAMDSLQETVGTVEIASALMIDENDLLNLVPGTDQLRRYGRALDFRITYRE